MKSLLTFFLNYKIIHYIFRYVNIQSKTIHLILVNNQFRFLKNILSNIFIKFNLYDDYIKEQ